MVVAASAVGLGRVQLPRQRATTTTKTKKKKKEDRRARERPGRGKRTFACFWVSLYILLPAYTCRRVSRRCSGLNILAAQPRLASSCPSPLRLPEFFFVFFLRIIATMARKQTRNPLVTSARHPSAARIQNIPPGFRDGGATVKFRDEKYGPGPGRAFCFLTIHLNFWIACRACYLSSCTLIHVNLEVELELYRNSRQL